MKVSTVSVVRRFLPPQKKPKEVTYDVLVAGLEVGSDVC